MQYNSVSAKLKSTWHKNNNILAKKKKNLLETWATQDVHHSVTTHLERGSNNLMMPSWEKEGVRL